MNRTVFRGFSLVEMLVAMTIFGIATAWAVSLFASAENYYWAGATQSDVQTESLSGQFQLLKDLQESNIVGIRINSSQEAVLMVSARDSNGVFQYYRGLYSAYLGKPDWQKWVCYYLMPAPRSNLKILVRKEGVPTGLPDLPVTGAPPAVPIIPAGTGWEAAFRTNTSLPMRTVALDVESVDIEFNGCSGGAPLFVQLVTGKEYGGKNTNFNPGSTLAPCSGKSGYWEQAVLQN